MSPNTIPIAPSTKAETETLALCDGCRPRPKAAGPDGVADGPTMAWYDYAKRPTLTSFFSS
jgi:hypothetical protein